MNRFRVGLVVAAALLALPSAGLTKSPPNLPSWKAEVPQPLLGMGKAPPSTWALTRLDPRTLRRLPGRAVDLGKHGLGWSFSPDRSQLVLGGAPDVRFVDVKNRQALGDVSLDVGVHEFVQASQWLGANEVVAMAAPCCWQSPTTIAWIDAGSRQVTATRAFDASLIAYAHAPDAIVLVLGPHAGVGPARLVRVGSDGDVRETMLDRISAGGEMLTEDPAHASPFAVPGVAVDSEGSRAIVVGSGSLVAEVDLKSLAVRYHDLAERALAAAEKGPLNGGFRTATWLGNGILAVSGYDLSSYTDADGNLLGRRTAAGVSLLDTRDWSVRMLDRKATDLALARGALVTTGQSWGGAAQQVTGTGLSIYSPNGRRRAHLFGKLSLAVQAVGSRVFVASQDGRSYRIVDVAKGRIVRTMHGRELPELLVGQAASQ